MIPGFWAGYNPGVVNRFLTGLIGVTLLCASSMGLAITEHTETLRRSEWPEYINGPGILGLAPVHRILQEFEEDEKIIVEIRYPGGDPGRAWAESLAGWLVTFGVPEKYIELYPGSGVADLLIISLIDRR